MLGRMNLSVQADKKEFEKQKKAFLDAGGVKAAKFVYLYDLIYPA